MFFLANEHFIISPSILFYFFISSFVVRCHLFCVFLERDEKGNKVEMAAATMVVHGLVWGLERSLKDLFVSGDGVTPQITL